MEVGSMTGKGINNKHRHCRLATWRM